MFVCQLRRARSRESGLLRVTMATEIVNLLMLTFADSYDWRFGLPVRLHQAGSSTGCALDTKRKANCRNLVSAPRMEVATVQKAELANLRIDETEILGTPLMPANASISKPTSMNILLKLFSV